MSTLPDTMPAMDKGSMRFTVLVCMVAALGGLLGWQDAVVVQIKALTNIPPEDQLMYSTYFGGSLGGQAGKEGRWADGRGP